MEKEFYNIWLILISFTIFFHETAFSNILDDDFESHFGANTDLKKNLDFVNPFEAGYDTRENKDGPVVASVDPSFAEICAFEEIQLTASGAENYLWVASPGNPSGGGLSAYDIPNPIFSNGFPGSFYVYDVIVSDNSLPANADTARVIISVLNNPFISITPFSGIFVCENEEVLLTASGGVDYLWEDAITGDSLGEDQLLQIKSETTKTIRVIGTDSNGCFESNQITIFVEEIDAFANASAIGVCEGDSVLLNGGTGDQLTWVENGNTIGFGNGLYTTPTQNTRYTLQIETNSGCRDSASVDVEFYEKPVVLNPIEDFYNCETDTFRLGIYIDQPFDGYTIAGTGDFKNDELFGNLLVFDAIKIDDTSTFVVTIFTNGGCAVVDTFNILPCECIPPVISNITVEEAKCNGRDGFALIQINNPEAYDYVWTPDLGTIYEAGNRRTNLPVGAYTVEIIDSSNINCSSVVDLLVRSSDGLVTNVVTTPASCFSSNGTATIEPSNFDYLWEDAISSNSRTDLQPGTYFVTVSDPLNPNCTNVISLEIKEANPLSANIIIDTNPTCNSNDGEVSIQVVNGSGNYSFQWQDGLSTFDSTRSNLAVGFYTVTIIDNAPSACEFPIDFVLADSMSAAEIDLNTITDVLCAGEANGSIDYSVNLDTSFVGNADTLITDGFFFYENGQLPAGDYCLILIDGNGCLMDELCFIITEPEVLDLVVEIKPDCGLGGEINLEISGGLAPYSYDWEDIQNEPELKNRVGVTEGFYTVTIYDSSSCMLFVEDVYVPLCTDDCDFFGIEDTLNYTLNDCFDTAEVCFPVLINNLQNCQILIDDNLYTSSLTSCDSDTFENGYMLPFEPGYHEVLIVDTLFDCFNFLIVTIDCSNTDYLCINEQKKYCMNADDFNLQGEIISLKNLCADTIESHLKIDFDLANLCVLYEGRSIGEDSICVEVCDSFGSCETFDLMITVENCLISSTNFFKDTVLVDETLIFCPDTSELTGEILTINNFCSDSSGNFVDFFLDQENFCIEYTGLAVGVDSACIEMCDDLGFCDTTIMCIVVVENVNPPVANDDCDTTSMGMPVVLNVLANDTLFGRIGSLKILSDPMWGTAVVNLDNSITYNASDEFCERMDSFYYEVCTDVGCDTASVCIWIECVDIFIFNAVSANRDGVNDVFYIAGIEDYPESILRIFNRWGNLIYEKKNYKNTWDGTYNGNIDLPDGTYFYLLELKDEDNRVLKGYLELFR